MLGCAQSLVGCVLPVLPAMVLTQYQASGYGDQGAAHMVRHFITMVLEGISHWVTECCAQDELTSLNPKLKESEVLHVGFLLAVCASMRLQG